jgi:hypothetical protein
LATNSPRNRNPLRFRQLELPEEPAATVSNAQAAPDHGRAQPLSR